MNQKLINRFVIGVFITLYVIVSVISSIHVINFFRLSNTEWLAITLAVAFEVGAAASLASIIALKKMNKTIVWGLFFILTAMQAMGNIYHAFTHLHDFQDWIDLFGLSDFELIAQKRILSIVSGAVLPLVALGFIKSLVDYIKPEEEKPLTIEAPIPVAVDAALINKDAVEESNTSEPLETKPTEEKEFVEIETAVEESNIVETEKLVTPDVVSEPVIIDHVEILEPQRFTEEQNKILNKITVFK